MKNAKLSRSLCWLMASLLTGAATRAQDTSRRDEPARRTTAADTKSKETAAKDKIPAKDDEAPAASDTTGTDASTTDNDRNSNRTNGRQPRAGSDKMLRLNFRGVALEMVLNYLSDAAGFIIVLDTEVKGKVDVWSNQPVTQDEALGILDTVLSKNGYAAIRNGRTLTIVSKESAKKRDIPVKSGSNPNSIPKTEEIVTQIIPIRFISASQLTQNLQALLPSSSELTANEAGNALIMTDTQINIRRITEIIRALDTSIAGATTIRVFPLRFADSKELANVIKELFPAQDTRNTGGGNNNNGGFPGRGAFGGGGFPGGGFPGGGNFGGGQGGNAGRTAGGNGAATRASASRVVAVADERSNSVIINAPDDVLPEIEDLITRVDTSVEDITELRVFRLRYADPSEMADVLSGLFPDDSRNSDSTRSQVRFGGGGFNFGGGGAARTTGGTDSDRAKKKGKVLAIADQRTSSVIVSAAHQLMDQIGQVVSQLDSNPARKQKVFVYDLQNADPQQVQEVLRNLFENQQTQNRNNRSSSQNQSSALTTRATQQNNNNNRATTGFGGGNGGGGGTGGGRTGGN
jgi:type II secretory pathway component GspD/PulD (secretin)